MLTPREIRPEIGLHGPHSACALYLLVGVPSMYCVPAGAFSPSASYLRKLRSAIGAISLWYISSVFLSDTTRSSMYHSLRELKTFIALLATCSEDLFSKRSL